jgi:DNA-binding transcriptional ArsR family regulator
MSEAFFSRIRLRIVAELLDAEWVSFADLQRVTDATKGNLGSHLARLRDEGIVREDKRVIDRRPVTRYRLTPSGRTAFLRHITMLEDLLKAARRESAEADENPITLPSPRTERTSR